MTQPNTQALRELMTKLVDDQGELTGEDLRLISHAVDELRTNILFDLEEQNIGALGEQDYLLGLCALEQATRHFAKAAVFRAGEIAGRF